MPVLGHSFSQRRKTKPRDLHIRKVSFSGSSLSSGCSFSSASSGSTARDRTPRLPGSSSSTTATFNPLHLHPTFQPPPRLYDRPLISTGHGRSFDNASTCYDGEDADGENSDFDASERDFNEQQFHMELPPHTSPMDHTDYENEEPQDYFYMRLNKRPALPRSRWSESTIQSLDQLTPVTSLSQPSASCVIADADEDGEVVEPFAVPNFSYKRQKVLKRPSFKPMDSFEEFVKRGGWKRRGIVFHSEDMDNYATR